MRYVQVRSGMAGMFRYGMVCSGEFSYGALSYGSAGMFRSGEVGSVGARCVLVWQVRRDAV